jgi:hypothetical protein
MNARDVPQQRELITAVGPHEIDVPIDEMIEVSRVSMAVKRDFEIMIGDLARSREHPNEPFPSLDGQTVCDPSQNWE